MGDKKRSKTYVMESSDSRDVEQNVIRISCIKDPKIRKTMQKLDKECDGDIDAVEVMRLKKVERFYRRATKLLAVVALLLIVAMFAVSFGAIELSKESHVSSDVKGESGGSRRRLSASDPYSPSTFVDVNNHEMVMGSLQDIKVPIGDGSTFLAQLAERLRRSMDPQRRRNRRVRRRRLKVYPKNYGGDYSMHSTEAHHQTTESPSETQETSGNYESTQSVSFAATDDNYQQHSTNAEDNQSTESNGGYQTTQSIYYTTTDYAQSTDEFQDSTYENQQYTTSDAWDNQESTEYYQNTQSYYTDSPAFESTTEASSMPIFCAIHEDCGDGNFCYQGYCAICTECHFCHDGIDGTCGTCAGGPIMEDNPNCDPEPEYHDESAEVEPPMGIQDAFMVECHVPEFATRYACPNLPSQMDYLMEFSMEMHERYTIVDDDATIVAWETSLCGSPAEMHIILSEIGEPDEIDFFYPSPHFGSGVRGMHCFLHVHVNSVQALQMFQELDSIREDERNAYISQNGPRPSPHMIMDRFPFDDLSLPPMTTQPSDFQQTTHSADDEGCPSFCMENPNWVGDDYCDEPCMECEIYWQDGVFDKNDCDDHGSTYAAESTEGGCPSFCMENPHWVGDDYCDEPCMECEIYWQDGVFDKDDCDDHESTYALESTEGGCPSFCMENPHWVGDNYCDEACIECEIYWQGEIFDKDDCDGQGSFASTEGLTDAPSEDMDSAEAVSDAPTEDMYSYEDPDTTEP